LAIRKSYFSDFYHWLCFCAVLLFEEKKIFT